MQQHARQIDCGPRVFLADLTNMVRALGRTSRPTQESVHPARKTVHHIASGEYSRFDHVILSLAHYLHAFDPVGVGILASGGL